MGTPEKPVSPPVETEGAIRAVSELVQGARVVYPNQGVCRVGAIQSKEIAGHKLDFISMTREEDDATIWVPVAKVPSIGLRHVADSVEIGDVFDLLASSFDDPELDWKVRHRMHGDLMAAGGVLGVAEVLKALQALANLRPLPQKERERYDAARHLLVHEVAVALGVPECTAEDFIDLALIPPPGTVRPASKPRKLATLPPKLQRPGRPAPRGESDELDDDLLLDDELPGLEAESVAESESETEGEDEERETEAALEPEPAIPPEPPVQAEAAPEEPTELPKPPPPTEKPPAKKTKKPAAKAAAKKAAGSAAAKAPAKKAAREPEAKKPAKKSTGTATKAPAKKTVETARKAPAMKAAGSASKAPAKKAAATKPAKPAAKTTKKK